MAPTHFPRPVPQSRQRMAGVMLLEALIAILIFSIGILGIIGLQATAVQQSTDAKNRAEAAYLADQLMGQLWTSDRTVATMLAQFDSNNCPGGCPQYKTWVASVQSTLPGVSVATSTMPSVNVDAAGIVTISIYWRAPTDDPTQLSTRHHYDVEAQIGQ